MTLWHWRLNSKYTGVFLHVPYTIYMAIGSCGIKFHCKSSMVYRDIARKQVFKQTEFLNLIPWPLTSKSRGSSKGHIRCKQLCKISLQKPKDFTQYCGKVKVLQTDRTIDKRTDRLKLTFTNFSGVQQTSKLSQLCLLSEVSFVWLNKSVRYLASGSKWFVLKTKVKVVKLKS